MGEMTTATITAAAEEASAAARKIKKEEFWKDFPTMADYFSRAVTTIQNYTGMKSDEVFHSLGETFGRKAAEKFDPEMNLENVLDAMSKVWTKYEIGILDIVNRDPLTLVISDCTVCGQLAGTGGNYDCEFHEGFFESLLSTRLGRKVELVQVTNYEGNAGTWCRRYVAN